MNRNDKYLKSSHCQVSTAKQIMCSGDLKVLLFFIAVTCFNTYYGQDVRLVGDGSFTNMGRLEVSVNNTWYAVCSFKRYYGDDTTAALRSNLGCKKLRRIYYSWFGVGNETKCLNNFYCSSRSAISSCTFSLIECCSSSVRAYFCDQGLEIANSSIRLVGGSNISGRVEVQIQDVWGSVETDGWNYHAARLVCRSQDLPWRAAMIVKNGLYGRTLGKSWMTDTECTGSENNLFQCWFNLQGEKQTFSNNAGVICADSIPVRLVDGDTPTSGRVEVYIDGKWGSVLSYIIEKDMTAKAICNILGTPSSSTKAFYVESGFYRKSSSITWLVKLYCSSDASSLYQCSWAISGYFSKSNNFGVVCQDINEFSIRLVNNQTANRGYVEVFLGGLWGTITHTRPYRHYTWGKGAATVACRQLGLPQ
ncbi:scavenger receptor cysteine-rich type 1 protein M130-like [Saccostrea cucullata]|uniref:scavenger receptor cysteine-rich type 1 protein M130-like n=1 Tax=Saccostrea cuccullata TaxID=36930 RepID=UPI002ED6AC5C